MNSVTPTVRSLVLNWALVAVALSSLAAVVATRDTVTSEETELRARHLFLQFDETSIQKLRIAGDPPLVVVRSSGEQRFEITEPVNAAAEEATVDQLLRALRFATWLREVPKQDADRKALGLDPAQTSIELTHGHEQLELRLGGSAPAPSGARYVEIRGGQRPGVFVVGESTARDLTPELSDFRVQRLIPVSREQLVQVDVASKGVLVSVGRGNTRGWHFLGRFGDARLDPTALDRLFLQFARVEREDFVDVEVARSAQKEADTARLTFVGKGEPKEVRMVVGGRCTERKGGILALREAPEPIAACIDSDVERALLDRPELLLDRKAFRLREDEVEAFRIENGKDVLDLARKEDHFVMREPKRGDVERPAGLGRLSRLLDIRGQWLDPTTIEAEFQARGRVSLTQASARESEDSLDELEFGSLGDREQVVRRLEDGALLAVDTATAGAFAVDALTLRSRTLFELQAKDVTSVAMNFDGVRQRFVQPRAGTFELQEPEGLEVDTALANDVVDVLRSLEAVEWVGSAREDRFGLDAKNASSCEFTEAGNEKPHRLVMGAPAPRGGFYASLDDGDVFVLSRSQKETLSRWVVDRSGFMLDTESVEKLQVTARGRSVTLERLGGSFVQTAGDTSMSEGAITELLDGLSLLRAEGLVTLKNPGPEHGSEQPVLKVEAWLRPDPVAPARRIAWHIGAADTFDDVAVYFAWSVPSHGLFALPRDNVRRLLEAF